ncbi:hypothetical protein IVB45_06295 [Bradyrhizobium sp. 4]|nr:hypothetical protein [Bradyrhizobium sp. 45]MCK1317255.1 hypothetical protein [Bradyrhizobium sp. 23]MCK1339154.1 hypothetical protein [Bradyrhizobium sp. 38]MCK1401409.1 hypothetical protein [Bradyrhizobium sp. 39]MCK1413155.1 hypothetical protein [Bradyrhizobium sp. CW4]MCK1450463.1 hypothetical protein [Bradyrhizobium sp. 35]MCK1469791.1 hypothetical protein [Bradyrhizobium sp. CW10]MCK1481855.1 hypothetical protein [Bradyrhizobium sp. 193]MCK1502844.1 hypothetical protein [Bradyrhizo
MLDADAEGADWREVSRIILRIDPEREPARARPAFESHLERAKWVADSGYRRLLRQGWPSAAERARSRQWPAGIAAAGHRFALPVAGGLIGSADGKPAEPRLTTR